MGDFMKTAGGAEATAAAAAAAANAAAPRRAPLPADASEPMKVDDSPMKVSLSSFATEPDASPQGAPKGRGGPPVGRSPQHREPAPQAQPPVHTQQMSDWGDASASAYGMYGGAAASPFGGMYPAAPYMAAMYSNPWSWGMDPMSGGAALAQSGMYTAMPMVPYPGMMAAAQAAVPAQKARPAGGGKNQGKAGGAGAAADLSKSKGRERRRGGKTKNGREQAQGSSPTAVLEEPNPNCCAALTEVRKQGTKCKLTLAEVLPNILEFVQDQHGSRFLQTKLDEASEGERNAVFSAVLPESAKLASDVFGNFVVQKLFDIGNAEQKKLLAMALQAQVLKLSNETYGCRVIQKAIQHVSRESQLLLAAELNKNVIGCIESMHGNHVIQKCIEQMPPDSVNFIIRAVEEQTEKMASHMYGCRVIQRLLEHCATQQLQRMLEQILSSIPKLALDPYGNYVVQHMLEHGRKDDKRHIIAVVRDNIVEFSRNKCSSNVVEKCFEIATVGEHATTLDEERMALMIAIVGKTGDPNPPLYQMMDDRFGNYIVQRMLEHSRGPEKDMLRQKLLAAEQQLRGSVNGKHILAALAKEFTA